MEIMEIVMTYFVKLKIFFKWKILKYGAKDT